MDIRKLCKGCGYKIVSQEWDTTNIICERGHIYANGNKLVASLDAGTPAECRSLRKLGTPMMDGDFGELGVAFEHTPETFRAVARILRPKQSSTLEGDENDAAL